MFALETSVISLNVDGFIYPNAYWTSGGIYKSTVNYIFQEMAKNKNGVRDLDSSSRILHLILSPGIIKSATVQLVNPAQCSIGGLKGASILDTNVKLVTGDGIERSNGPLIVSLFLNKSQKTKLRLKNVPFRAQGKVYCKITGNLTYSF